MSGDVDDLTAVHGDAERAPMREVGEGDRCHPARRYRSPTVRLWWVMPPETNVTAPAIDLLAPASFAHGQPHEQFTWLREHDPVHWHEEHDGGSGFWAVTRYRDVKAVGRDAATFSSKPSIMIPDGEGAIDVGA